MGPSLLGKAKMAIFLSGKSPGARLDKQEIAASVSADFLMTKFLIIIPGIPILTYCWLKWSDRRLREMNAPAAWRWFSLGSLVFFMAGYLWILVERKGFLPIAIPGWYYACVLLWGVIFLPALAVPLMSLSWIRRFVRFLLGKIFPGRREIPKPEPGTGKMSRRHWLGVFATALPALATIGTTLYSLPRLRRFRLREMTILLPDLPDALDGIRIAHVTDTHVGKFTRGSVLDDLVTETNRLDADLILFTGDLIDNRLLDLPASIAMLQRMRSKSGLYLIEGNHDLFDNPENFRKRVRKAGLNFLRDEAATVSVRGVPVQILGIAWSHKDDELAHSVDTVHALRDSAAYPLLLAHHPHAFDRALELGYPLTLAGHTHGGQLMITGDLGAGAILFRYWTGLYRKMNSQLIVSNGAGNWFPLRVNAPAEIIHLTLRKG